MTFTTNYTIAASERNNCKIIHVFSQQVSPHSNNTVTVGRTARLTRSFYWPLCSLAFCPLRNLFCYPVNKRGGGAIKQHDSHLLNVSPWRSVRQQQCSSEAVCLVSKVATREITEQFAERVALKIGSATMLSIWGCPSCCSRDEENTVVICWTCCLCSYLCVKDRLCTLFTLPFVVSTLLGSQSQAISSRTTASTLFKLFCPCL